MSDAIKEIRPVIEKTPYKRFGNFSKKENWILLSMCAPVLVWLLLFRYLPMAGLAMAFQNFRPSRKGFFYALQHNDFVGFDNFKFLFATSDAWVMTRNTMGYNLVFIFVGLVLSVALAIALHEMVLKKLSKLCQTILIMPYFLSWVTVGLFASAFLSTDTGVVNQFLAVLGVQPLVWYSEPKAWPYILVIVNFWKMVGYSSVIYLAALSGLDLSMYESARLDGATKWQQIRYLTIPSLCPIMIIMTILAVGRIFFSDFGLFYILPNNLGVLYPTTTTIDTYVYRALISLGDMGMATAAGLYQSIVGLATVLLTNWWVKRINPENSLF